MGIIRKWREPKMETIYLGRNNINYQPMAQPEKKTYQGWLLLWRRFKREHKAASFSRSNTVRGGSYDPEEYSQNFDQGIGCNEPDNLSRSFSARFADPSRIRRSKILIDVGESFELS